MRTLVYGSRPNGHARVVIEFLEEIGGFEVVGLLDDFPANAERRIGDVGVVGGIADLTRLASDGAEALVFGYGATDGRMATARAARAASLQLPALVHPTAWVAASASVADGAQILQRAVVSSGARIGVAALLGSGVIVEHDGLIGDGAVIGPGSVLAGRVTVEPGAELGAGAVVLPDIRIGAGARVGAGAVVTRDVADGVLVVGVPARGRTPRA